jgi:hypothetical protein
MDDREPKIVAFFCNWCTYGAADLAGVSRSAETFKQTNGLTGQPANRPARHGRPKAAKMLVCLLNGSWRKKPWEI